MKINNKEVQWELVYGETTYKGIAELIKHFDRQFDEEFTFIDVGCGYGKALDYVKNYFPKSKCIGIEIDKEKAAIAIKITHKNIKIVSKDFRDCLEIISSAHIVFANSIMFYNSTFKELLNNCNGLLFHNHQDFTSEDVIKLESSWSKECKYYKLNTNTKR